MQKKIRGFLPSERRTVQAPHEMLNNMVCGGRRQMRRREGPRERPEICWYLAERPPMGRKSRWHREICFFALDCEFGSQSGAFLFNKIFFKVNFKYKISVSLYT